MLKPSLVGVGRPALEVSPERQNLGIEERVLELRTVALRVGQVEERGVGVQLVPRAHHCDVRLPVPLERQHEREVRFVDPHALVGETLGFEAAELQRHVGRVFEHLVAACGRAGHVLEYLAHQAIATAWIRGVHNLHLLLGVACCVPCLVSEEKFLLTLVSVEVF